MAQQKLKFIVRRKPTILVAPCQPTPREVLYLSNLDDQVGLRIHTSSVQFYKSNPSRQDLSIHPATLIKHALERLLVHYYPIAGRLREAEGGKLVVDCTAEGVLYIEADAAVSLWEFGELQPPFPCWEELLYDVPGSKVITNSPLLLIQLYAYPGRIVYFSILGIFIRLTFAVRDHQSTQFTYIEQKGAKIYTKSFSVLISLNKILPIKRGKICLAKIVPVKFPATK